MHLWPEECDFQKNVACVAVSLAGLSLVWVAKCN